MQLILKRIIKNGERKLPNKVKVSKMKLNSIAFVLKKSFICTPNFLELFSGCSVARLSRLLWEQEVASSNLATPTKKSQCESIGFFHGANRSKF